MLYEKTPRKSLSTKNFFRRLFGAPEIGEADETRLPAASGIIHDLANPLTVISMALDELMRDADFMGTKASRHIETAVRASKKMKLFLTAAKRQLRGSNRESMFDASKETSMAIKLFRSIAKRSKVKIKYRSPKAVFISGDRTKMFRVISNLISNAIDSYAHLPDRTNRLVIVRVLRDQKGSTISVRDFGCGIPRHLHKKIFEPFYTTKQRYEGVAGLGLSIVKKIVEDDFDGNIRIESSSGRGTIFSITIPDMADNKS